MPRTQPHSAADLAPDELMVMAAPLVAGGSSPQEALQASFRLLFTKFNDKEANDAIYWLWGPVGRFRANVTEILRTHERRPRDCLPATFDLIRNYQLYVEYKTLIPYMDTLITRPSSLQRELSSLEHSGILQQRKEGRRTYFKAETRSPIFRDLRSIFEKTVGLIPTLRAALRPFGEKITSAFVYGSIARREERAISDVDLMVIATVGVGDLVPSLRKAEKRLGREVNVTNYSVDEFRKKVTTGDHFLTTVLKGSLEFVKGEQRDLDAIAGK